MRSFERDQEEQSPRWPSGIQAVQNKAGGFYSFTAVSGKKKLGKSMLAVRSSIEAAETDQWYVHFLYGEGTAEQVRGHVRRVLGPERSGELPQWMDRWRAVRFGPGTHIETLVENISVRLPARAERLLIVLDSGNRLARFMQTARRNAMDYLRGLGRICQIAQTSSEESGGAIGWLVLSETNQRGGMVGLDVEHSASCLLYLRSTRNPEAVKMKLESRESEGGDLGTLKRVWQDCRFKHDLEVVKPEAEDEPGAWGDVELPF